MTPNRNSILWLLIVIFFVGTSYYAGRKYLHERSERIRITESFSAANQELVYYKAENGMLVARNQVLELRSRELRNIYPEILQEIRNLKIKPNRVESFTETVVETEKQITTVLRDSIIHDTIQARVFDYADEFYNVSGIAIGDTQQVYIHSTDSLIQVVYKGKRRKPWLWIFSSRNLEQAIACKNPNAIVKYSRHIEISKP